MIMQTVSLADELTFIPNNTGNIRAVTNTSYIPEDKRNLAVAAAETFFDALGKPEEGMTIKIDKRIQP